MFGLFKKKKSSIVELPTIDPEEIHKTLLTSSINYLTTTSQNTTIVVEDINSIRIEYNKLCNLGLGASKNAQLLKSKIDAVDAKVSQINTANSIIDYIHNLVKIYGYKAFLVSDKDFDDICAKYNLSIGILRDYCGTIPNENIKEIEEYLTKESSYQNFLLYTSGFNRCMFYILEYTEPTVRDLDKLHQFSLSCHNIVKCTRYLSPFALYNCENTPKSLHYVRIKAREISQSEFFIACPEEYLHSEVNISPMPIDPIVFRECPHGKVIFTMWGKEAEDKVLEEFKKLNNLI